MQSSYLAGEDFPNRLPIHEWIKIKKALGTKPGDLYEFLDTHGKYFQCPVLEKAPEDIPFPDHVLPGRCHFNTVSYAKLITRRFPNLAKDFELVSGTYGLQAINDCVPATRLYCISHHSFLIYKGSILDWTNLYFPPHYYKADQYFGISFSLPAAIGAIRKTTLVQDTVGLKVPLIALKRAPFLV